MSAARKFKLLGGVANNLRGWVENRRWGRQMGLPDVVANAQRHIDQCVVIARRINAIPITDQLPFVA